MARPLRLQFEGALYHVTFRGNEKRVIFRDDVDRRRFLHRVRETQELRPVRLFLLCLMPNHVHLLLGTPVANLSVFMARLLTAYASDFNRRHRRVGHLTQGRFKAQVVEGNEYLLKLSRYIHLNPVAGERWTSLPLAERRQALRDYPWSTYRGYIGAEAAWENVDYDPILAVVAHGRMAEARDAYRDFVETGLARDDQEFAALYRTSRLGLGSEDHVEALRQRHEETRLQVRHQDGVALRRVTGQQPTDRVLQVVARVLETSVEELRRRRRSSRLRAVAAWALQRFTGLNQRMIAEVLGMRTGAAVSHQLARWNQWMASEGPARRLAEAIKEELR